MTAFDKQMLLMAVLGIALVIAFWGTVIYVGFHFIAKFW